MHSRRLTQEMNFRVSAASIPFVMLLSLDKEITAQTKIIPWNSRKEKLQKYKK
jgi:hypothetical protein